MTLHKSLSSPFISAPYTNHPTLMTPIFLLSLHCSSVLMFSSSEARSSTCSECGSSDSEDNEGEVLALYFFIRIWWLDEVIFIAKLSAVDLSDGCFSSSRAVVKIEIRVEDTGGERRWGMKS